MAACPGLPRQVRDNHFCTTVLYCTVKTSSVQLYYTVKTSTVLLYCTVISCSVHLTCTVITRHGARAGEHLPELYEFADKTGILERHKQLLARPGHETQVMEKQICTPVLYCDTLITSSVH